MERVNGAEYILEPVSMDSSRNETPIRLQVLGLHLMDVCSVLNEVGVVGEMCVSGEW